MILNVDALNKQTSGKLIMECWKRGIEINKLNGYVFEVSAGNDTRVEQLIKDIPPVNVLHKELIKEISIYDQ